MVPIYSGTVYMASEIGGHIGIFDLTIDPTSAIPITITNGGGNGQIKQLSGTTGAAPSHIIHDVRLDVAANKVYYSTIIPTDAFTSQHAHQGASSGIIM